MPHAHIIGTAHARHGKRRLTNLRHRSAVGQGIDGLFAKPEADPNNYQCNGQ
jgi:hypothetical protein